MVVRSAIPTIIGYFYQFDYSILSILRLPEDDDRVSIECVEDIDVQKATETTAIQCKYYERSEYNHSVIKSAIIFMMTHYKECLTAGKPSIRYQLKGHFSSGQDKLSVPFDIQFLKDNFLTYVSKRVTVKKHEELGVTDQELVGFLDALTIDIHAEKFDKQFQNIVGTLKTHFNCTPFAAEFFFYNNALRIIKELSTKENEEDRKITRREFVKQIDTSSLLFDEWFVAKRGKDEYYKKLRNEYFSSINTTPAERLFIIHISCESYHRSKIKYLLREISRKYSKISRRDSKPFSPYALIHGLQEVELIAIKQELHNEGFRFIDGHGFKGSVFDPVSISGTASYDHGPELRIFNSLNDALQTFQSLKKSREIYEFYRETTVGDFGDDAIRHVRFQTPSHEDIWKII